MRSFILAFFREGVGGRVWLDAGEGEWRWGGRVSRFSFEVEERIM